MADGARPRTAEETLDELRRRVVKLSDDLHAEADDVIWIGSAETLADRVISILDLTELDQLDLFR